MVKDLLDAKIGELDKRIEELTLLINNFDNHKQELLKTVGQREMAVAVLEAMNNESNNTSGSEPQGQEAADTGGGDTGSQGGAGGTEKPAEADAKATK